MDCSEAKSHLSAFASGLTNDLDKREIEEHLATCEECSLEVELLRGRASGDRTAAAPADWTLEKIFGGGGGSGGGSGGPGGGSEPSEESRAESAPSAMGPSEAPSDFEPPVDAAPTPAPEPALEPEPAPAPKPMSAEPPPAPAERPSMILPPPDPLSDLSDEVESRPRPKRVDEEAWAFEPADASRESAPPQESVAFAEQALDRKKGSGTRRKSSTKRVLMWSVGGLAGVGLLGVSAWLALRMQEPPTQEITTQAARTKAPDSDVTETPTVAADTTAVSDVAVAAPAAGDAPDASGTSEVAAQPSPAASTDQSGRTLQARAIPSGVSLAPDGSSRTGSRNTATPKSGTSSTGVKPQAETRNTTGSSGTSSRSPASTSPQASTAPKPLPRDDDDMWPTDDPVSRPSTRGTTTRTTTSPPQQTTATTVKNETVAVPTPPPPTPVVEPQAPVLSASMKAIERLHLETEKATTEQNLATLRQLKTTWKDLIRTTVGRDRSRAKREYAECLWDIQTITGRESDQRETLQAYRDYLINAPAGGADSRSAERLRELEDASREKH